MHLVSTALTGTAVERVSSRSSSLSLSARAAIAQTDKQADKQCAIVASTIAPNLLSQPSPRGIKRSRSPDGYGAHGEEADGGTYPKVPR